MPFLHYISNFEGTSYKKLKDTANSSFISCCFTLAYIITLAFTAADITFHIFLEIHSTLSEKIFSSQILLF